MLPTCFAISANFSTAPAELGIKGNSQNKLQPNLTIWTEDHPISLYLIFPLRILIRKSICTKSHVQQLIKRSHNHYPMYFQISQAERPTYTQVAVGVVHQCPGDGGGDCHRSTTAPEESLVRLQLGVGQQFGVHSPSRATAPEWDLHAPRGRHRAPAG